MLLSTPAIVLQTIPYGDTSVIARMYTLERGMISFIVKGAKGGRKNKKSAFLQALSLLDVELNYRENHDLQFIREMRVLEPYTDMPFSAAKTAQALFIAEVLRKAIQEEEKNEQLFSFLQNALLMLDKSLEVQPDFHLKFLLELSHYLGFHPVNNYDQQHPYFQYTDGVFHHSFGETCLDLHQSQHIALLMNCSFSELDAQRYTRAQRRQLSRNLLLYFKWHLPAMSELQTPDVLEEVFG